MLNFEIKEDAKAAIKFIDLLKLANHLINGGNVREVIINPVSEVQTVKQSKKTYNEQLTEKKFVVSIAKEHANGIISDFQQLFKFVYIFSNIRKTSENKEYFCFYITEF